MGRNELVQGERAGYRWLEIWGDPPSLPQVAEACPEIVLGKRVVAASFDSSPFIPSDDEVEWGWIRRRALGISPSVEKIRDLPCADGFDEWYVFPSVPAVEEIEKFPYDTFTLDPSRNAFRPILERFWRQLLNLQPESYLGWTFSGTFFITRKAGLFDRTVVACRRFASGAGTDSNSLMP